MGMVGAAIAYHVGRLLLINRGIINDGGDDLQKLHSGGDLRNGGVDFRHKFFRRGQDGLLVITIEDGQGVLQDVVPYGAAQIHLPLNVEVLFPDKRPDEVVEGFGEPVPRSDILERVCIELDSCKDRLR